MPTSPYTPHSLPPPNTTQYHAHLPAGPHHPVSCPSSCLVGRDPIDPDPGFLSTFFPRAPLPTFMPIFHAPTPCRGATTHFHAPLPTCTFFLLLPGARFSIPTLAFSRLFPPGRHYPVSCPSSTLLLHASFSPLSLCCFIHHMKHSLCTPHIIHTCALVCEHLFMNWKWGGHHARTHAHHTC